jgi:hypothetical protein
MKKLTVNACLNPNIANVMGNRDESGDGANPSAGVGNYEQRHKWWD